MAVGHFKVTIPADIARSGKRCANGMCFGAAVHDDGHFEPFVCLDIKVSERGLAISEDDLDIIVRRIQCIVVVLSEAETDFLFRSALRRVGLRAPEPGVVSDGTEIVNATLPKHLSVKRRADHPACLRHRRSASMRARRRGLSGERRRLASSSPSCSTLHPGHSRNAWYVQSQPYSPNTEMQSLR